MEKTLHAATSSLVLMSPFPSALPLERQRAYVGMRPNARLSMVGEKKRDSSSGWAMTRRTRSVGEKGRPDRHTLIRIKGKMKAIMRTRTASMAASIYQ